MEKRKTAARAQEIPLDAKPESTSRRKFIGHVGSAAAASLAVSSTGLSSTSSSGQTRYYDSRGNSLGTSTTTHGTTTFYGPRGNVTGTAVAPARRK